MARGERPVFNPAPKEDITRVNVTLGRQLGAAVAAAAGRRALTRGAFCRMAIKFALDHMDGGDGR